MKNFKQFMSEGSKEEYKKFFDAKLKKYGVDSPEDLSDEDKKKFYDEIDKEWNADHEAGKDGKSEDLVKEYIKKDGARRRCAGGDGRKGKKVKTEEEDCEDDEEMEEGFGKYSDKVDKKKLMKKYRENEDDNAHTENYLMLATFFGTEDEVKKLKIL